MSLPSTGNYITVAVEGNRSVRALVDRDSELNFVNAETLSALAEKVPCIRPQGKDMEVYYKEGRPFLAYTMLDLHYKDEDVLDVRFVVTTGQNAHMSLGESFFRKYEDSSIYVSKKGEEDIVRQHQRQKKDEESADAPIAGASNVDVEAVVGPRMEEVD